MGVPLLGPGYDLFFDLVRHGLGRLVVLHADAVEGVLLRHLLPVLDLHVESSVENDLLGKHLGLEAPHHRFFVVGL